MQQERHTRGHRTPPPDIVLSTAAPSLAPAVPPTDRDHLIIGLFALRLARRLISSLGQYPERDSAVAWIDSFLAPYPLDYALARVSGPQKDNYLSNYPRIVSAMKKQPRYPMRFMELHPLGGEGLFGQGRAEQGEREWTDGKLECADATRLEIDTEAVERMNMMDFCDAAAEWGSTVPMPAREARRMTELADRRRVAELRGR